MKTAGLFACLLAFPASGGDLSQIQTFYQSIIAGHEPTPSEMADMGGADDETIRNATPEQIQMLLPLAQKCLQSPKRNVRATGVGLFLGVVLVRWGDSAKLLGGYIDDLAALLDDPDQSLRTPAAYTLGHIFPKPPPKALAYLDARLNDKTNEDQAGRIAVILLDSGDAALVSEALRFAEPRPQLKGDIIRSLGLNHIATDEALKFIHSGFQDPKFYQVAVDAVGRLPRDAQKGFAQDLAHVIEDPNTDPRVAERARQALAE